jgi:hypothetical protein
VNSNSAVRIDEEIGHNVETDAFMTIANAGDQGARLRQGGQAALIEGKAARSAANSANAASLISFAGTAANTAQGWKRAAPTTTTGGTVVSGAAAGGSMAMGRGY